MKKIIIILTLFLAADFAVVAGNPDRAGQAGGTQLLVNGWARSSGMGWAYNSMSTGVEAMYLNVGGLAYTGKTQVSFSNANILLGTGISANSFGIAQKVGADGVLGIAVSTMSFGDIMVTTVNQPDGGLGTYSPTFTNFGVAYSKKFTDHITGGVLARVFSESISNAKTQGIVLDAGIQYVTSTNKKDKLKKDDIKFGVSLKNVGPDSKFSGDGLSTKLNNSEGNVEYEQTVAQRTAAFNLPALINIGISYDMRLDKSDESYFHRLTPAFNFTSNAFSRNQFTLGFEYGFKSILMLRGGFAYEEGIFDNAERTNAYTGLIAGATFSIPLNKETKVSFFELDYSYRASNPFGGTHTIGASIDIGSKD